MPLSPHRRRMANIAFQAAATKTNVPNIYPLVASTTKPRHLWLLTLSTTSAFRTKFETLLCLAFKHLHLWLLIMTVS